MKADENGFIQGASGLVWLFIHLLESRTICLFSLCVSSLLTLLIIVYAKIGSWQQPFQSCTLFFFFEIGVSLVVNSSWKNPSGEWHVGYKFLYELLTGTLTSRLKVKQ